jgi:F420-dependent oxidoreductase-like protein
MKIGLSGGAASVDRMVGQAERAEAEGFSSLWYASAIAGDPLVAMAFAGKATKTIELGTSVLQTYTCHPVLMAQRAHAVAMAMGRPGFTLGLGPSHKPNIEAVFGYSYDHPGRHTEEYVSVIAPLLRGEGVELKGEDFQVRAGLDTPPAKSEVTLMISALAPRLLRVAGEQTAGTILWMGNGRAVETHVGPLIRKAAASAGRPEPRIVAGLPVAVCDDEAVGRETAGRLFAGYGVLPNYRRILDIGGAATPGDAAIVGNEESVTRQLHALVDAGTTDIWAAIFPVGDDSGASRDRTRSLLRELVKAN